MSLMSPREFDALCTKASALMPAHKLMIKQINQEYRWAHPASHSTSVGERVNVHSGGSNPTLSIAGGKEAFRQSLREAVSELERIVLAQERMRETLESIKNKMRIPDNRSKLEYDHDDRSAKVGPGYLSDLYDAKRRREQRGEAYGEG